jgi:predicted Zn-dependent protease
LIPALWVPLGGVLVPFVAAEYAVVGVVYVSAREGVKYHCASGLMAKKRYNYDVFPTTWKSRALVALALVAGLALLGGYFAFALFAQFGDWWDDLEITFVNETETTIAIYVDHDLKMTLGPEKEGSLSDKKFLWKFVKRDIEVRTLSGRLVYATSVDDGDLKETDYRIVIRPPVEESANESASDCATASCLGAQDELAPGSVESCGDSEASVCIAPLGWVSPELVRHLVDYYRDQYGLTVSVLTPSAIPENLLNSERAQVDAHDLLALIRAQFEQHPGSVVIGLTSVDMYISTQDWRYAFGLLADSNGVISTIRMSSGSYGEEPYGDLLSSRARKLVSKYIGLLHYGLPLSSDPESAMYNNILGPDDLDRMTEPLPIALN